MHDCEDIVLPVPCCATSPYDGDDDALWRRCCWCIGFRFSIGQTAVGECCIVSLVVFLYTTARVAAVVLGICVYALIMAIHGIIGLAFVLSASLLTAFLSMIYGFVLGACCIVLVSGTAAQCLVASFCAIWTQSFLAGLSLAVEDSNISHGCGSRSFERLC